MSNFKYNDKNIYYKESGTGEDTLVLLHGNTASSKMFDNIIPLLENDYRVITLDFLGCGNSDRLEKFNTDLWYDEAMQTIGLLDYLKIKKVNLIGSSGGAIVAINIGLERPDLVNKIIADSFEGEESLDIITANIISDRENSKKDMYASQFYKYMNGEDWMQVIDNDTNAIYEHSIKIKKFYHKNLNELFVPILFTGSKKDEFLSLLGSTFYEETYEKMAKKVQHGEIHMFNEGSHPAMLSNMNAYVTLIKKYIKE